MMRTCIKCGVDVTYVMAVRVFRQAPPLREVLTTDYVMCVECGRNGDNAVTAERLAEMLAAGGGNHG